LRGRPPQARAADPGGAAASRRALAALSIDRELVPVAGGGGRAAHHSGAGRGATSRAKELGATLIAARVCAADALA
ncbi:MAG TPA: hypothetical protein VHM70_18805, partial [Polyangiaceae bacterium]|nr:hypothetical protein [Polyangiaceae bacterium]